MARTTLSAEEFVAFFDACLQIRWCRWNPLPAAPANKHALGSCGKNNFRMARLLKCADPDLGERYDPRRHDKYEDYHYTKNDSLHVELSDEPRQQEGTAACPPLQGT
jgi:hypothetical protein